MLLNTRSCITVAVCRPRCYEIFTQEDLDLKKILEQASQLVGKKMVIWNIKANLKQRWHGSCEYFHQDAEYWKSWGIESSDGCTAMVFIDDHSHLNGGLWVIPNSHNAAYKHVPFLNINNIQKKLIPTKIMDRLATKNKPVQVTGVRGDALVFHSRLVHGSGHNISGNNRRTLLIQMCTEDFLNNKNEIKIKKSFDLKRKWEKEKLEEVIKTKE